MITDLDVDLIALTETWFRHDMPPELVSIPGYSMFWKSRVDRQGGGVAMYANNSFNPEHTDITVPNNLEVVWVKLRPRRLPREISCIFCATIYFPQPDNEMEAELIDHLLSSMDQMLTRHPLAAFILLGDFNRLNVAALLNDSHFHQVVEGPTRGENTLDKIITNISTHYEKPEITSPIGNSDHNTILWYPVSRVKKENKIRHRLVRPMPDSAIRAFGTWISSHDWSEVTECRDVDDQCNQFYETLHAAIQRYFPLKKTKLHPSDKPWMSGEIKALIHDRQAAFHRGDKEAWKRLKESVIDSIKKAKKAHYPNRIKKHKKQNPSKWYREIRNITGGKTQPIKISVPGTDPDDHRQVANRINDHFISVSSDLQKLDLQHLPSYLPAPSACPTVYPWQVHSALSKIRESTSGGPDGISARIIRLFSVELATPLAGIINASTQQGKIPKEWKRAIVVPIPKTSPAAIDKLRPISLTDHFAKVAESFVAEWVLHDITPKLDPNQFGNRKSLSSSHCLINILHPIYQNAEKPKSCSSIVQTDFKKAFDRIDHSIAISKLIDLGVRPAVIPWICDFLSARQQCVRYRDTLSEWSEVQAGVPQGTHLGPIIFLVMINDAQPHNQLNSYKYVDDLTLVECRQNNQPSQMQTAVDNLASWSEDNNMQLNPTKCVKIDISFSRTREVYPVIHIRDQPLDTVCQTKILGVHIQNDLKWESHVSSLEKRANGKMYMLRTLKSFGLPRDDLIIIFIGYVRPMLEYASPVWNSGLTQDQNIRLERIQRRALRIIYQNDFTDYNATLALSNLDTLEQRRKDLSLRFFKSTLSSTNQFQNFLPKQQQRSTRVLRKTQKIPQLRCKTKRMQTSPIPSLIQLYNDN